MEDRHRAAGARAPDTTGGRDQEGRPRDEDKAQVKKGAKAASVDDLMEFAGTGGRWNVTVLVLGCCCECVAWTSHFADLYRSCIILEVFPAALRSRYVNPDTSPSSRRGFSLAGTFMSPLQTLSYEFLGATPEHWCKVQPLLDANWTQHQVLSLAIPPR